MVRQWSERSTHTRSASVTPSRRQPSPRRSSSSLGSWCSSRDRHDAIEVIGFGQDGQGVTATVESHNSVDEFAQATPPRTGHSGSVAETGSRTRTASDRSSRSHVYHRDYRLNLPLVHPLGVHSTVLTATEQGSRHCGREPAPGRGMWVVSRPPDTVGSLVVPSGGPRGPIAGPRARPLGKEQNPGRPEPVVWRGRPSRPVWSRM